MWENVGFPRLLFTAKRSYGSGVEADNMEMDNMRTDPMVYVDSQKFIDGVVESLPTMFFFWMFADFL